MANSLMFIFLLESIPGKILNQSLEAVQHSFPDHYSIKTCNCRITDPLLQIISRELDALVTPNWLTFEDKLMYFNTTYKFDNAISSIESFANFRKAFDTSFETLKINSLDSDKDSEKDDLNLSDIKIDDIKLNEGVGGNDTESRELEIADLPFGDEVSKYPGRVPFLVAIFESLTNMTAQTCAGTLLSPHWVLTAASCVDLLNKMYHKSTNISENSTYTVIADATDPLLVGTPHNVTAIHVNPTPVDMSHYHHSTEDIHHFLVESAPAVALLRIEPPVTVEEISLNDTIGGDMHVMVYGWSTVKEKNDSLHATRFEARTISAVECAINYNLTEDSVKASFETCLTTSDDNAEIINQMSWGGPVLSPKGLVVAVAHGDGHVPLSASPLGPHVAWIRDLIHEH